MAVSVSIFASFEINESWNQVYPPDGRRMPQKFQVFVASSNWFLSLAKRLIRKLKGGKELTKVVEMKS